MLKTLEVLKPRDVYLNRLIAFQDTESVKVITGIRRWEKSSLLKLMQTHLLETGIEARQIISMNFESMEYRDNCITGIAISGRGHKWNISSSLRVKNVATRTSLPSVSKAKPYRSIRQGFFISDPTFIGLAMLFWTIVKKSGAEKIPPPCFRLKAI